MTGRRTWLVVPAAAGVLAAAVFLGDRGGGGGDGSARCRRLLIPAYVPPNAVLELARAVRPALVVVNPASGPGPGPEEGYRTAVRQLQRGGTRVLGYVPTGYGTRDPAQVTAEIDRYASWYRVDGIFLDEASGAAEQLTHYRALAEHVRAAGRRLVVLNPGVVPDRGYFDIADVVVTFEGPYTAYAPPPEWVRALPPDRIATLVYGASRVQAAEVVDDSDFAGYVYVTSGMLPHPWGTVPDYLREERAAIDGCASLARRAVLRTSRGHNGQKADRAVQHAGQTPVSVAP